MLTQIVGPLFNLYWDIRDTIENKKTGFIGNNIITLPCLVSEDLPMEIRNSYCKSLEVVYAAAIKSILSIKERSRFDSSARDIFRSIPILTPYDKVKYKKDMQTLEEVSDWFFNREYSGKRAIDVFTESYIKNINKYFDDKYDLGMEASDIVYKESRAGVPTYVEIAIVVDSLQGRAAEKRITIGVEVRPKVVSNVELVSMFVKRLLPKPEAKDIGFFTRMKNIFKFNSKRPEIAKRANKSVYDMMNTIEGINKPFVCVLLSGTARDMLLDAGVTITNSATIQKLYAQLPIMSIGIYDTNTDTIQAALTRDSYFVTRTAGEFNSEISNYEKQLSEMVRVNKVYG